MTPDLRRLVLQALAWSGGVKVIGQILSWAMTLYIIRLLSPQDYGVMALAMLFISLLSPLTEFGLGAALIKAETLSKTFIRQTLGFTLTIATTLGLILSTTAHIIANFFNTPALTPVLFTLALTLLISGFTVVPRALLLRKLNLRTISLIELAGTLSGGILTLILAYLGEGVWALVWGMLFTHVLNAILFAHFTTLPGWPSFNFRGLRKTLAFSSWVTLEQMLWKLWSQADVFIIGLTLGGTQLGSYSVAKELAQLPQTKVQGTLNAVALPAYAEAHRSGGTPNHYLCKYIRLSAMLSFPVFWGIAITAPVFVPQLLGEQWLDAVLPLQIISFAMPVRVAQAAISPFLQALGMARLSFGNMGIGLVLMAVAVAIGSQAGLVGVSMGWSLAACAILLVVIFRTAQVVDISALKVLTQLCRSAIPAVLMALCIILIDSATNLEGMARLATQILVGAASYVTAVWLLNHHDAQELLQIFRRPGV